MKRLTQLRPSPALIVAMIALFVALGGGATAGTVLLITGAQIKNNTVTSKDIKNGTINSKDLKNNSVRGIDVRDGSLRAKDFAAGQLPVGATGPQGPAGAPGPAGPQGPAGPLLDALPSGKTLRGVYAVEFTAAAGVEAGSTHVTFQPPLAATPTVHAIPSGGMSPPECTGSATAPEAQAGHLCLYEASAANHGGSLLLIDPITDVGNASSRFGFAVSILSSAAGTTVSRGTWAVTAP